MTGPYFEIVFYTVPEVDSADKERRLALERVAALPGFIAWTPFTGATAADERVDLVAWATAEDALSAARIVGAAPEFAAFRATISRLVAMGHYHAATVAPVQTVSGDGIEFGRFRLKPGIGEDHMRAAYAVMVERHLSRQPGWRGQRLVKMQDGTFIDLAFADSPERAAVICASWRAIPECDDFLALVEPISMEFGTLD